MKQLYIDIRTRLLSIADSLQLYRYVFASVVTETLPVFSGGYTGGLVTDVFTVTITEDGRSFNWVSVHGSALAIPLTFTAPIVLMDGISIAFTEREYRPGESYTYTITGTPLLKFVQVWNNQLQLEEEGETYDFLKPAVFIEMVAPSAIQQMGNGAQIYDPLIIRLHIAHEFYNAIDPNSTQEQDLLIFDLRQSVYASIQMFEPDNAVAFFRISETQDYTHKNLYHYIQEYQTNYIDNSMLRPVRGIVKNTPTDTGITVLKVTALT